MTVRDLLTRAAGELNIFDVSTPLSSDDADYILQVANDYLDGLKTEDLTVSVVTRQTFPITPSVTSYAVGLGATINVDRPVNPDAIVSLGYLDSAAGTVEVQTGPPMSLTDYVALSVKSLTGTYPAQWYYEPTLPTGTLLPSPIPTSATLTGVIYAPSLLAEFTDLNQTLVLAPGARRFLRLNLALEIADAFEKQPSNSLVQRAQMAKTAYKAINIRPQDMQTMPGGDYDINSDTYRPR